MSSYMFWCRQRIRFSSPVLVFLVGFVFFLGTLPTEAQQCLVTTPIGAGDDVGTAIAVQADGRIVHAGYALMGSVDFAIVRYNSDLTLDPSFGTGGIVTTDFSGGVDHAEAVTIQANGKIVVAGYATGANRDFAVARYNIDGSLDTSFGAGGKVTTPIPGGTDDEIEGVAIDSSGNIVVAGSSQRVSLDSVVARYDSTGSLDLTFDGDGIAISPSALNDAATALVIQPADGKIVTGGHIDLPGTNVDFAAVRYNTDGSLDGTFGAGGLATTDFGLNGDDFSRVLILQPDGKIVLGGETFGGGATWNDFGLVRFDANGILDGTFSGDGRQTTDFFAGPDLAFSLAIQPDDKLVTVGYVTSGTIDWGLTRHDSGGTLDSSFDGDGRVTTAVGAASDYADAVIILSSGKILTGGYSSNGGNHDFAIARYDTDGSLDTTCFATNYRSIGTDSGTLYNTGDAAIEAGSTVVNFGSGASLPDPTAVGAIGRGDVLTLDPGGPNEESFYLLSLDSSTQVTVQAGAMLDHSTPESYAITRAYTTLQSWENPCGASPCLPDSSGGRGGDLVSDNRSEVGIAYKDSTDFTSGIDISGSTTDDARFLWLTVASGHRHHGTPGSGVILDGGAAITETVNLLDDYTRFDWFEVRNYDGASGNVVDIRAQDVHVSHLIVHDFPFSNLDGISIRSTAGAWSMTVQNCLVYDGGGSGIQGDTADDTVTVENSTIYGCAYGVHEDTASLVTVRNTVAMGNGTDFNVPSGVQSNNLSSDATASGLLINKLPANVFVNPGVDFHLKSGLNDAVDAGLDLSSSFWSDIDGQSRLGLTWDIGADERDAPTAVSLTSFDATGYDASVLLEWETGSELDNLGFNLYRSTSPILLDGSYELITERPIPGLGSSPEGAKYRYTDMGLTNGVTYYYKLEDIETTGTTKMHGPVSATPQAGATRGERGESSPEEPSPASPSRITVGDPEASSLRFEESRSGELVLELTTGGFYATPHDDGTIQLEVPGYDLTADAGYPSLPVRRSWVEVLAGLNVELVSVQTFNEETFDGLRPASTGLPFVEARQEGTVRLRRAVRVPRSRILDTAADSNPVASVYPEKAARVMSIGFQEDIKKALVEMAPIRWDPATSRLTLAHRLVVRLRFEGRDLANTLRSGRRSRRYVQQESHVDRRVVARLVTTEPGLYGVAYEELYGSRGRKSLPIDSLRLSRQGEAVPLHVDGPAFGPRTTLYFVSVGAGENPYGHEAVYELETGATGELMATASASPSGEPAPFYWETVKKEENISYQPALIHAPDRWLWSGLFAPVQMSYPFEVSSLAPTAEFSRLSVFLQGSTDFSAHPDHHVRLTINNTFVGEGSWNGKEPYRLDADVGAGLLREGDNTLEIENVGDTEATYSMVMLNRFELTYPRRLEATNGRLEGSFSFSGTAEVSDISPQALVLERGNTGTDWKWLTGSEPSASGIRFRAEQNRHYMAVGLEAVRRVTQIQRPRRTRLKTTRHKADVVMIGPKEFLLAARPLIEHRRAQGLRVKAVAIEDVFSEFGFGEENPKAIKDFLAYTYHNWEQAPRYVLLLGDATYDFKNDLGSDSVNRVPPLMVMTSYLETASDPAYAAVNGDDLLPDLAIGRLPAASVEELDTMVQKILAWEANGGSLLGKAVLVADNPDPAGNFVADAETLASTILANQELEKIYLSRLGTAATKSQIQQAFNGGASLMNYIGHGGIQLWADENILNTSDIVDLAPQSQQPMLLTMNCLNGYFHFPYFNSMAEELLKAEGKGVVAAFSPSGLSLNYAAHVFHQTLLEELVNGGHTRLGNAVMAAQSAYAASGALPEMIAIYHLFGDPAMKLQ